MPQTSAITQQRIEQFKLSRFNPIRYLTPEVLSDALSQYDSGTLEWPAQVLNEIMERDPITLAVSSKRRMKAETFVWDIIKAPDATDAEFEAHRAVLKYNYDNLILGDALDRDKLRGVQALFGEMNNAQGMKWQIFEILGRPSPNGFSVKLISCPLWFFENRTGKMRFLVQQGLYNGVDMLPEQWMIVRGLGLMKSTAIAYMFAHLPKQLWLWYCEAHSLPMIVGKTKFRKNTPEYDAMVEIAQAAGTQNGRGIIGVDDVLEAVSLAAQGALPYEALIEKMEKLIMALWLGGDLSTQSSAKPGQQVGATNQAEDQKCIEDHDAQVITETLNQKIDKYVLAYHFGPNVIPAAYIKVMPKRQPDVATLTQKYNFALTNQIPVGIDTAREAFGLEAPQEGEELIEGPKPQPIQGGFGAGNAANVAGRAMDALTAKTISMLADAKSEAYRPLAERMLGALEAFKLGGEPALKIAMRKIQTDKAQILHEMNQASGSAINVLDNAAVAAWFNGAADAVVGTYQTETK